MLNGQYPCYRVYKTKDGKYLTVGALEKRFWENLCRALEREDLIPQQYATGPKREETIAQLEEIFLTRTRDEWVDYLDGFEICHGPVNDFQETFADPQVLHREMILLMDHPTEGPVKQLGFPIKFSKTPGRIRLPSPGYGEHTRDVLRDLGYSNQKIEVLEKSGVI